MIMKAIAELAARQNGIHPWQVTDETPFVACDDAIKAISRTVRVAVVRHANAAISTVGDAKRVLRIDQAFAVN